MIPNVEPNRRRVRQFVVGSRARVQPAVRLPTASARLLHRAARAGLLATTDAAMIGLAVVVAFLSWAAPVRDQSPDLYLGLAPLVLLFLAGYARAGLYPGLGLGPIEMLRRGTYVTTFGFLVLTAVSFALKIPPVYSRVTFVLAFLFSLVTVPLGRQALSHIARRWSWWAEPVVVIGTGPSAARAIRGLRQAVQLGYGPAAVLATSDVAPGGGDLEGVPILGGLEQVSGLTARGIRVALLEYEGLEQRAVLDRLQQAFLHVILLRELDQVPIESLKVRNLGSMVGIEYTNNLLRPRNQTAKRLLDVVVATAALVVALPLIALAALAVLVLDGPPAFFHQDRAGLGGRRIRVPKVRTMRRNADRELEEFLASHPSLQEEWLMRYKLRDDPRLIPGIGRFFRRFSIDELPQLFTVIAGDMSLVGPRPFPDYHCERFTPGFLELRQRVRPGITGLWQITVRSSGNTDDQEALDAYYIRNWSVWFDLYVLGRTLLAVVSGRGAY